MLATLRLYMDEQPRLKSRISRLQAVIVTAGVAAFGLLLVAVSALGNLGPEADVLLVGIGASLIGSASVSILLFLVVEPWRDSAQADVVRTLVAAELERTRVRVVDDVKAVVADKEERDLDSRVYAFPESDGLRREYNKVLTSYLESSRTYGYYGATAVFTAYRFFRLKSAPEIQTLDEIRISIVNPNEPEKNRALTAVSARIRRNQNVVRHEILMSLCALFDIRAELPTEVYLHSDLTGRRLEVFDDAVFETLYVGSSRFPNTDVYRAGSRRYRANRNQIDETAKYSFGISFGSLPVTASGPVVIDDEAAFRGLLHDLSYSDVDLRAVRRQRDARFAKLDERLRTIGITEGTLF